MVDRGIELDFYSVSGMAQRELLGMHVGSCLGLKLCAGVMVHLAQSLVCSPMSSLHVIRPGQEVNRYCVTTGRCMVHTAAFTAKGKEEIMVSYSFWCGTCI